MSRPAANTELWLLHDYDLDACVLTRQRGALHGRVDRDFIDASFRDRQKAAGRDHGVALSAHPARPGGGVPAQRVRPRGRLIAFLGSRHWEEEMCFDTCEERLQQVASQALYDAELWLLLLVYLCNYQIP